MRLIYWIMGLLMMPVFANAQGQTKTDNTDLAITLQKRIPKEGDSSHFIITDYKEHWNPTKTAIIICDMWDKHWCNDATVRVNELAPSINKVISIARNKGVLIVHSPSDCMPYYKDYRGRKEALKHKNASFNKILSMLSVKGLPSEEGAVWPVDQSDGGCTNPTKKEEVNHIVWLKENDQIKVTDKDIISDAGDEIAGVFAARGIKNVIFMGVHTNMCIIQRSFGMRNMVRLGMNVVLMRDLTDLMYDSQSWPYVSHFKGLDLMIAYIEKYIAPTILSTDFTHEKPFVFPGE